MPGMDEVAGVLFWLVGAWVLIVIAWWFIVRRAQRDVDRAREELAKRVKAGEQ